MSWWSKVLSGRSDIEPATPNYFREGTELLAQGHFTDALTSFRLALREEPDNVDALQQIAITYTRVGMLEEAVRNYRRAIELDPAACGAHYGLAFLLLQRGEIDEAAAHLRAFLAQPPGGSDAAEHVAHAREVLAELTAAENTAAETILDVPVGGS